MLRERFDLPTPTGYGKTGKLSVQNSLKTKKPPHENEKTFIFPNRIDRYFLACETPSFFNTFLPNPPTIGYKHESQIKFLHLDKNRSSES